MCASHLREEGQNLADRVARVLLLLARRLELPRELFDPRGHVGVVGANGLQLLAHCSLEKQSQNQRKLFSCARTSLCVCCFIAYK